MSAGELIRVANVKSVVRFVGSSVSRGIVRELSGSIFGGRSRW